MNLRRNRRREIWLALGATLLLISTGLLRGESKGAPVGKTLLQEPAGAPKNDPRPEGKQSTPLPGAGDQYTIGPKDVLQINVWRELEITGPVSVRPDGNISMPLIGDLKVSGLTPATLQATLTEKLPAFMSDPEVAVQ